MQSIKNFRPQKIESYKISYIIKYNYLFKFKKKFLEKLAEKNGLKTGYKHYIFTIQNILNRINGDFTKVSKLHMYKMLKYRNIKYKRNEKRDILIEKIKETYVDYYAFGFDISLILNQNNKLENIYNNEYLIYIFNKKINKEIKDNEELKKLCDLK